MSCRTCGGCRTVSAPAPSRALAEQFAAVGGWLGEPRPCPDCDPRAGALSLASETAGALSPARVLAGALALGGNR